MSKPVAVVTGGAGFIGSHMVDILVEQGFSVRVIDNMTGGHINNLQQHEGNPDVVVEAIDVRDLEPYSNTFNDAKFVFHFAGVGDIVPSIENPIDYMATNVQGTVKVLECSRHANVDKFVYAASSSCYGLAEVPTTEDHLIDPQYPYALSKYQGEQAAYHWHKVYGLPVNSICIFNAYGPRVRTTGAYGAVFGVFFRQKLAGKPYTVVGDGTQRRDFIYVRDVAKAFYAAADTTISGERFNVGADTPVSINRLVEILGGETVKLPKRPGEPDVTHADISKITSKLNWQPEVPFEEGVQNMLVNIERWNDAPLWDEASIADATKSWFRYMSKSES
ncbi:GDP-mannose 4,6-dehydratase [Paracoccaceae bacterium]|jgi:UDP-glucose 4-epimerase|nr:GDP-mannose 4,6-dehydratase [Paracoccaceae bacterium]